jgi:hypothetical protein
MNGVQHPYTIVEYAPSTKTEDYYTTRRARDGRYYNTAPMLKQDVIKKETTTSNDSR